MLFLDRSRDREVRWLEWRVRLFLAGGVIGVVGMYVDASWVVWVAVAVLFSGLALRFLPDVGEADEGG